MVEDFFRWGATIAVPVHIGSSGLSAGTRPKDKFIKMLDWDQHQRALKGSLNEIMTQILRGGVSILNNKIILGDAHMPGQHTPSIFRVTEIG